MRTLRARHERNQLYILANGKCQICGNTLGYDWQVDHIIPYLICKETIISNLQATCKICNLKKGTKMLRKHQKELVDLLNKEVEEFKATGKIRSRPLVLDVFPGGGKSSHPILATKILKDAGIIEKICWVVPRRSLKNQGAAEFLKEYIKDDFPHNLEVRETELANDVNPTRGSDGFITTYQALVSAKGNNTSRDNNNDYELSQHKYLLILDECQHVSDSKQDEEGYNYYKAVKSLVDKATYVMCVSGTLFRHEKDETIAFIDYKSVEGEDGLKEPVVDIRYSYHDAIADKAIIPIVYDLGPPELVKYTKNGEDILRNGEFKTNTDLSVALESEYANQLLESGLSHWQNYRATENSRSKLIIIGHDQKSCRRFAKYLKDKGVDSCLAISDEGLKAYENIKDFRTNPYKNVLITCQMAYEGLDCKQATHLIVLTKIRSKPWLMQMFTRIMRFDKDNELSWDDQEAFAFVPNDKAMMDALGIINATIAMNVEEEKECDFINLIDSVDNDNKSQFCLIENQESKLGNMYHRNLDGNELPENLLKKVRAFKLHHKLQGSELPIYNMLKTTGSLAQLDKLISTNDTTLTSEKISKTLRDREKDQRDEIEKLTRQLDYKFGLPYGSWNKKVFNHCKFTNRKEMTLEQLKQVCEWIKKQALKEAKEKGLIKSSKLA